MYGGSHTDAPRSRAASGRFTTWGGRRHRPRPRAPHGRERDGTRRNAMGTVAPGTGSSIVTRGVVAWALYDLANTIFSFSILTIYFPLWVVDDMGGRDGTYGLANSVSMALVFLSAPFAGTLSDQVPRRLPFLAAAASVCAVCTGLIGSVALA